MKSIFSTLNCRRANFQLFKEIVRRTPWETVLRDRGTEQSWQLFKDVFHRAQELSIPKCKKSGSEGKRPAWLRQETLVKLRRGNCTGSGSRDWLPGKSIGKLPGCVEMGQEGKGKAGAELGKGCEK